jgi:A/G-specific adenine glycosylase
MPASAFLAASAEPPFSQRVIAWQRSHGRHRLPWLRTRDPYRVWLSEIMLQQTQVATVLGYYERFLERFPDVRALAAARLDEVLALWSGLGYYGRARNLHRCAVLVVAEHGGEFPATSEALARLPGIGRSTAAAIAAFCFGERVAILDGNVKRVLARLLGFEGDLAEARSERALWQQAGALLPQAGAAASAVPAPGLRVSESLPPSLHDDAALREPAQAAAQAHDDIAAYTQGLMDLGATVCTARSPACLLCPAGALCVARRQGTPERYPVKTRRTKRTRRENWWLWLEQGDRVFLRQRPPTGVWAGLWTLPLHDDLAALDSAAARLGVRTEALAPIAHALTHFDWLLHTHRAVLGGDPPAASEAAEEKEEKDERESAGRWFRYDELSGVALPAPLRRLLASREAASAMGGDAAPANEPGAAAG